MNTWYSKIPGFPEFPVVHEDCCELKGFYVFLCPDCFVVVSQQWHDDYKLFRTVFVYLLTGLEHYQNQK